MSNSRVQRGFRRVMACDAQTPSLWSLSNTAGGIECVFSPREPFFEWLSAIPVVFRRSVFVNRQQSRRRLQDFRG